MEFEFDPAKALAILKKHRVSFEEGASVFGDSMAITLPDPDHSAGEERWLTFGVSRTGSVLAVVYTERRGRYRLLIGARPATKR